MEAPNKPQTHLHEVTVMLQHTAGGLPGVLVTLPGVHPAPNINKQPQAQKYWPHSAVLNQFTVYFFFC